MRIKDFRGLYFFDLLAALLNGRKGKIVFAGMTARGGSPVVLLHDVPAAALDQINQNESC